MVSHETWQWKHRVAVVFCLLLVDCSRGETSVDTCSVVQGKQRRLDSLRVTSQKLVVDKTDAATYDRDAGRYKRTTAETGFVSYMSSRGFERITIEGYVFGELPKDSWSLRVNVGNSRSGVNNSRLVLRLGESNLNQYLTKGGANRWRRFLIELPLKKSCPEQITLALSGSASNNEFPGWGLQVAEVRLTQSWFRNCKAECRIKRSFCPAAFSHQMVDKAESFKDLYSKTSNVELDASNPYQYYNGDVGRFKRSNKEKGEIVYAASRGIYHVEVEVYQYKPYFTRITLLPYISDKCRPTELAPVYTRASGSSVDGWVLGIARFNLTMLPFCAKRVAIRMSGGEQGWEIQISRITVTYAGDIETANQVSFTPRLQSDSKGFVNSWWLWTAVFLSISAFFLLLAAIVRRVALCFGDDSRSVYHISRLQNVFRSRKASFEVQQTRAPSQAPPIRQKENSFTFYPPAKQISY